MEVQLEREVQEASLASDPRWLLVQRILASEGFQRAGQLRKILVHIARSAILMPDQVLREYEIALEVLDRRQNFDPGTDNIVRAQFTHLRRKLERYFLNEGREETLSLTIPKGSYHPVFLTVQPSPISRPDPQDEPDSLESGTPRSSEPTDVPASLTALHPDWRYWHIAIAGVCLIAFSVAATVFVQSRYLVRAKVSSASPANQFVQFLARFDGAVEVVVPDSSEAMIRLITDTEIPPLDYARGDFWQKQLSSVKDPAVRVVLSQIAKRRNATITEAEIAFDMVDTLRRADVSSKVLYARDLHVRDLNEGSAILIGSQHSDPWISLFADKTNFRFVVEADTYYFANKAPLPGEQSRYEVLYANEKRAAISYADVAFFPNASQSGYILLILGSDSESNEATARFLMHGRLPPEITSLLARKDLHSFEIFLRGKHTAGEANDSLEVVSVRPK